MSNDDQIDIYEDENKRKVISKDGKSSYQLVYNVSYNKKREEEEKAKQKVYTENINTYLASVFLTILLYVLCAWCGQVALTEIINVELPLSIFLTILLVYSLDIKNKYGFIVYSILAICLFRIQSSITFMLILSITSVLVIKCIDRIYTNKKDYNNITETAKSRTIKNRFIDFLSRMKYYIILSFIIFIVALILGYFYPGQFQSFVLPALQQLQQGVQNETVVLETASLFINNFTVAFNMFIHGITLSISTLYLLIYNAMLTGFVGSALPLTYFLSYTLPHGIIELPAIILASAAGFRLTHALLTIVKGVVTNTSTETKNGLLMILDSIILMIIVIILLIIAAYIEANMTVPISNMLMGI